MNSDNLSRFHIPHLGIVLEEIFGMEPWLALPSTVSELATRSGLTEAVVTERLNEISEASHGVEISCRNLQQLLADAAGTPPLLVDVREPWEFDICRIPGSLLLHGGDPDAIRSAIEAAKLTVMICHHGVRSFSAAMYFRSLGCGQVKSLAGGLEQWAVEVDPDMARY